MTDEHLRALLVEEMTLRARQALALAETEAALLVARRRIKELEEKGSARDDDDDAE